MTKDARKIGYPRFAWPRSGWWLTALGTLAGIAFFLCPDVTKLKVAHRGAIAVGLGILTALLVVLAHLVQAIVAFCRRAANFDALLTEINGLEEKLQSTQFAVGKFIQERANRNAYAIDFCYSYENRTFIGLRKKRGPTLSDARKIIVVDAQTDSIMGHFFVTRQTDDHYLCEREGYMDALWLGNIKQHGSQHSEAPPEALAIAIMSDTIGDDDE